MKDATALLDGSITVVELGSSLAGSYCGRMLSQLGATVTAVEPPEGSAIRNTPPKVPGDAGLSAAYAALIDGKTVFTADLEDADGRASIEKLVSDADVVIMSGSASVWQQRGFTSEDVRRLTPAGVIGRVTTFGDVGPYADWAGAELQAQALGGLMNMIGEPDAEPIRIGGYTAEYATGMSLLAGVALGLFRRSATGAGSSFSTSVIETVAHMEWKTAQTYMQEGRVVVRGWRDKPPLILPCRDGLFAFFYHPHDWPIVKKVVNDARLEDDRFSTDELRRENRDELAAIITEFTIRQDKVDLYHLTQANKMTAGYVATVSDLFEDQQYQHRDFFDEITVPAAGAGKLPGAPWRWVGATTRHMSPANGEKTS